MNIIKIAVEEIKRIMEEKLSVNFLLSKQNQNFLKARYRFNQQLSRVKADSGPAAEFSVGGG